MTMVGAQNDSFPLPAFEDRLWEELAHLHAETSVGAEPDTRTRARPRRQRLRYLTVVGGLIAAATLVVVALVADDDAARQSDSSHDGSQEVGGDASTTVPDAVVAVPDALVIMESYYNDGSRRTQWWDEATGVFRTLSVDSGGNPLSEQFVNMSGEVDTPTETYVDHVRQEYWTFTALDATVISSRQAEIVAHQIEAGDLIADGTENGDLRFVASLPGVDPPTINHNGRVLWVDPHTMRPVREFVPPGIESAYITEYTYLERTTENLGLLDVTIPDGYERVASAGTTTPVDLG